MTLKKYIGKWKAEIPKEDISSSIQIRTYELYHKKIENYDLDDVRFMIVQKVGLKFLVPIALQYLREDILLEAMYYEGDLLSAVLSLENFFWKKNLKLFSETYQILLSNKQVFDELNLSYESDRKLKKLCDNFLKTLTE